MSGFALLALRLGRRMRTIGGGALACASIAVIVASCDSDSVQPKTGPGTEWPCGTHGKLCSSGSCCPDDTDCGGDVPSCRKGSCCYRNDTQPIAPPVISPIMR